MKIHFGTFQSIRRRIPGDRDWVACRESATSPRCRAGRVYTITTSGFEFSVGTAVLRRRRSIRFRNWESESTWSSCQLTFSHQIYNSDLFRLTTTATTRVLPPTIRSLVEIRSSAGTARDCRPDRHDAHSGTALILRGSRRANRRSREGGHVLPQFCSMLSSFAWFCLAPV